MGDNSITIDPLKGITFVEQHDVGDEYGGVNTETLTATITAESFNNKAEKSDLNTLNEKIQALSSVGLKREVVNALPDIQDAKENVIYMVGVGEGQSKPVSIESYCEDHGETFTLNPSDEAVFHSIFDNQPEGQYIFNGVDINDGMIHQGYSFPNEATITPPTEGSNMYGYGIDPQSGACCSAWYKTITVTLKTFYSSYDEYMYIAMKEDYELLGNTSVDLSNYLTLNGGRLLSPESDDSTHNIIDLNPGSGLYGATDIKDGAIELHNFYSNPVHLTLNGSSESYINVIGDKEQAYIQLRDNMDEDISFKITPTSVEGNDTAKTSWKKWLEVPENVKSIFDGSRRLTDDNGSSMKGQTVVYLQEKLKIWVAENYATIGASAFFNAEPNIVSKWNSGDKTQVLESGIRWIVTIVSNYLDPSYAQIRLTNYSDEAIYYVRLQNYNWNKIHKVGCVDETPNSSLLNIKSSSITQDAGMDIWQGSQNKFGVRVKYNFDDANEPSRFCIHDSIANKSVVIVKSENEIKTDAF